MGARLSDKTSVKYISPKEVVHDERHAGNSAAAKDFSPKRAAAQHGKHAGDSAAAKDFSPNRPAAQQDKHARKSVSFAYADDSPGSMLLESMEALSEDSLQDASPTSPPTAPPFSSPVSQKPSAGMTRWDAADSLSSATPSSSSHLRRSSWESSTTISAPAPSYAPPQFPTEEAPRLLDGGAPPPPSRGHLFTEEPDRGGEAQRPRTPDAAQGGFRAGRAGRRSSASRTSITLDEKYQPEERLGLRELGGSLNVRRTVSLKEPGAWVDPAVRAEALEAGRARKTNRRVQLADPERTSEKSTASTPDVVIISSPRPEHPKVVRASPAVQLAEVDTFMASALGKSVRQHAHVAAAAEKNKTAKISYRQQVRRGCLGIASDEKAVGHTAGMLGQLYGLGGGKQEHRIKQSSWDVVAADG